MNCSWASRYIIHISGGNILVTMLALQYPCVRIAIQLKLLVRGSTGNPRLAMQEVLQLSPKSYVGVIIGDNSGAAIEVANLLAVPIIDRSVIGCTATSSWLSKPKYSNFVRTAPSDYVLANMMAKLIRSELVGWVIGLFRVSVPRYHLVSQNEN